ncbi:MAG: hypothetical protein NVS3B18_15580 [Candidatus Dormibacteria bacterium]
MLAHLFAPVNLRAAAALDLPRRLPGAKGIALTFDDGPHPEGTPAVLEVLARTGTPATFFVIGEQVQRRPSLLAEIAAAGHAIGLHGFRHRLQARLPPAVVREAVRRGVAAIEDVTGASPVLHRPPFGVYSPAGLDAVRAAGLRPLLWSRWGKDWRRHTTPNRIANRVLAGVVPGDVILLHDADFYSARGSHRRTAAALVPILRELDRRKVDTVLAV